MPRVLTPETVASHATPGQLDVHGAVAVYTLRRVAGGMERTELWTVPLSGGEPRALVAGHGWRSCPRIDPSGAQVAFLAGEDDGPAQVHLVALAGGEARRVTDFPRGVTDLAWAPDSSALIVLAEDDDSDRVYRAAGLPGDASPTALVLTTIDWRADGEGGGGLRVHPRHLHRLALDGSAPVRLTSGARGVARPRVDVAGRVYFLADDRPDGDIAPVPQVWRQGAGVAAPVTHFPGGVLRYHLTEGGVRALACPVAGAPDSEPPVWFDVSLDDAPGGASAVPAGAPRRLGDPGRPAWHGRLGDETDLHDWTLELDDCAGMTTLSRDGASIPVDTATDKPLLAGAAICGALAAHGSARVAVLSFGLPERVVAGDPGHEAAGHDGDLAAAPCGWGADLYAIEGAGPRRLTDHGRWIAAIAPPRAGGIEVVGAAGPVTVLMLDPPEGVAARGTVIDIHGGPVGQWGVTPPLEAILLACAGFRVAMPNIRGSIDRGPGWVAALGGAWGEADVADVLAVADDLVARGLAEADRIGVMGLSYGGFLTQYLIGATDRFAAAVAENGVTNQVAAWAGSDLGPSYNASARLADPLTPAGVQRLWRASPLAHVAKIRTPLLMLQGADDRTCPASDNEQLFVALRVLRREVEYVLYPEESHLMQATGRIDRRIDRHRRVLAWFDTHLGRQVRP